MNKLVVLMSTVLFTIITAAVAYPQSLADLSNKERERRQQVKDDKVITDEEAARFRSEPLKAGTPDQPDAKADGEKKKALETGDGAVAGQKDPDEPVDFKGRTESYWRNAMSEARQKVKDLENESNAIVLKLNDLHNKFYSEDDGFKREGIQREIQKSFYEQDRNKEELAKAQDIVQDLEKEARKSGALPGWLR